jgi:hypothetical protein
MPPTALELFILNGFIGSFLATVLWAKSPKELASWEGIRNYIVGVIAGYIYYGLHIEWNFPNGVMCLVFSYFGKDLIEAIFGKLKSIIISKAPSGEKPS